MRIGAENEPDVDVAVEAPGRPEEGARERSIRTGVRSAEKAGSEPQGRRRVRHDLEIADGAG
ncbi:hypothetical protein ACG7TL_003320 [Trametes sanguinea]